MNNPLIGDRKTERLHGSSAPHQLTHAPRTNRRGEDRPGGGGYTDGKCHSHVIANLGLCLPPK